MTNFAYNQNIPNPPNNPSTDAPNMQTNTNSVFGLIAVDHIGFTQPNGGAHNQVQLQLVPGSSPPSGLIGAGFETLYSQQVVNGELFFVRGGDPTGIRMTGPGSPSSGTTGKSFLPGGFGIEWGVVNGTHGGNNVFNSGDTGTVTFPTAFLNSLFTVTTQVYYNSTTAGAPSNSSSMIVAIDFNSLSRSSFNWKVLIPSGSSFTNFTWIAIGN